ncbi:MAG: phytanoyl-CoA dioxygenase family protein [Proteobacteria bacterium]|nr:phytanoyl-CoA dioxygenase family protein [Pseudomonadota bacterium]
MSQTRSAQTSAPTDTSLPTTNDPALQRILQSVESLGLTENLLELELQGYTVVKGVLSEDRIERAKAAILRRVERNAGHQVDPATATAADFHGMAYQHYLIFDDPVFQEILLEPKPLAVVNYLLGESCVLSSMGSHFRGPGGMPLAAHADGQTDAFLTAAASIANCNYALTPYTREAGALVMFPGSHLKRRQPTPHENWTAHGKTIMEVMAEQLSPAELDQVDWQIPRGGVTMEIDPGDAVIWHGNSWHAGWRREIPGVRINLAAYFCRPFMSTQERRGDTRHPEVFERYANDPRFGKLLGEKVFNGWQEEGPDFSGKRTSPQGLYD